MFSKHYSFSDDQLELADHFQKLLQSNASMRDVRRIFEGTDPYHLDLWKKMAEGGWLGLITDEKYGGSGLAMDDLCLLGREIGKTLAPLPFLGHVCLATQALCVAGSESNKKEYLKRFSDGSLLATLAFREAAQDDWRKTPSATVNNNYLTGKKIAVPNGACADTVIVSACDLDSEDGENISLYLADLNASSITRTKSDTIDPASNYASVDFNSTKVTRLHDDDLSSAVFEQIIYRATIVNAFIQSGSAESAFEMARNYSLERVAFGRQIGLFSSHKSTSSPGCMNRNPLRRLIANSAPGQLSRIRHYLVWLPPHPTSLRVNRSITARHRTIESMAASARPGSMIVTCTIAAQN